MDHMQNQLSSVVDAIKTLVAGQSYASFGSRPPRPGVGFGIGATSVPMDHEASSGSQVAAAVVEMASRVEAHVPNVLVAGAADPEPAPASFRGALAI